MINPARKRLTLVILVIAITVLSVALLTQFGVRTNSPAGSSTTLYNSTVLTQQKSTSTSSSSEGGSIFIGFSDVYFSLFATPNVTLNYTLTISQLEATGSHVTLSAVSTVPGVTLTVTPKELTLLGTQEAVLLGISVAPTVNSSTLPVEITASSANGETNSTFDFVLDRALVVLLPTAGLAPPTLHVSVGQEVTWFNLVDSTDGTYANVVLADGSAASPPLNLNDVWSHTFDRPGTYPYQVTVTGYATPSGAVIVA